MAGFCILLLPYGAMKHFFELFQLEICIAKRDPFMNKLKKLPEFSSETEERIFWESHDSSEYLDWSKAERISFPNLKPSTKTISLRLPETLLDQIKIEANKRDVPYQSLIKAWLADEVRESRGRYKP
jgi:predicted DNA binding CopG/RHH family protein